MESVSFPCAERFPRATKYNPEWVLAGISGAANPLWMCEWLVEAMELRPGIRVLDLGCGRGLSSVFLQREYGVEVWAYDLWFSAEERTQRARDAGVGDGIHAVHGDARRLPFEAEFFDAILSLDSFPYYGTDDLYLGYLLRFLKPGGWMGIAGAGLVQEIDGDVPAHLAAWWTPDLWCLHSSGWWRRHWERTGLVEIDAADTLENGWRLWLDWHRVIAPDNEAEISALIADKGEYLGYVRVVGRRKGGGAIEEPIESVPTEYVWKDLLKG
jgi:SAM-dependent methyltransferase